MPLAVWAEATLFDSPRRGQILSSLIFASRCQKLSIRWRRSTISRKPLVSCGSTDGLAITRVVDVRAAAALSAAVADGVAELGGLDAAVANAGVLTVGTWDTTTSEQWRTVVDINLIGSWNTCAAAIPHLVDSGGSLVIISSSAGLKGTPLHLPYTASKHGVVGLSRALANELAAQNIRVNTVHPTGVETGMRPESLQGLLAEARPDLIPIFLNALPMVMAEASDISNAVLFLVSDESRSVTGLEFKVDAGVTLR